MTSCSASDRGRAKRRKDAALPLHADEDESDEPQGEAEWPPSQVKKRCRSVEGGTGKSRRNELAELPGGSTAAGPKRLDSNLKNGCGSKEEELNLSELETRTRSSYIVRSTRLTVALLQHMSVWTNLPQRGGLDGIDYSLDRSSLVKKSRSLSSSHFTSSVDCPGPDECQLQTMAS